MDGEPISVLNIFFKEISMTTKAQVSKQDSLFSIKWKNTAKVYLEEEVKSFCKGALFSLGGLIAQNLNSSFHSYRHKMLIADDPKILDMSKKVMNS